MAKAYVIPQAFDSVNRAPSATQIRILYQAAVGDAAFGDGTTTPRVISGSFIFDETLTPAQNLTVLKQSVVTLAATIGFTLVTTDVSVFTAIN